MDLFFMNKPQEFMTSVETVKSSEVKESIHGVIYDEQEEQIILIQYSQVTLIRMKKKIQMV